jgi:hypothetical protein
MISVFTEEIDGLTVITRFDEAPIDPVATQEASKGLLEKTQEAKDFEKKRAELEDETAIFQAHCRNLPKKYADLTDEMKAELKAIQDKLMAIRMAAGAAFLQVSQKYYEILEENTVYFSPRVGEEFLENKDEAESLTGKRDQLKEGEILLRDGTKKTDLRGTEYWIKKDKKWKKKTIAKIGETLPTGAKSGQELTPPDWAEIYAQKDAERIGELTAPEKSAEKAQALDGALTAAALERSKLEISGETEAAALSKSKDFFEAKKAEIEKKYK